MHKLFKKGIAAALGLALSLTYLVATAVPVQAADNTSTYKASALKLSDAKNGSPVVTADGDNVKINYPTQYAQVCYEIPEEVKAAGIISVKAEVEGSDVALKLCDMKTSSNGLRGVVANYGGVEVKLEEAAIDNYGGDPKATKDDLAGVTLVNFQNQKEGENDIVVKSVTFTTEKAVGAGGSGAAATGTKEKTVKLADLKTYKGEDGVTIDGNKINYTKGQSSIFFKIPDEVLKAGIKTIKVNVGDKSTIVVKCCKSDTGNGQQDDPNDACFVISNDSIDFDTAEWKHDLKAGDVKYLGIAAFNDNQVVEVSSIVFTTANDIPKTGDVSKTAWMVMIALGCIALVAASGVFVMQRKRR